MKKISRRFNAGTPVFDLKFGKQGCIIEVTNVYVIAPHEGSNNKQSIEWALKLKPFLKLTFMNGIETSTKRLDISILRDIFDGPPLKNEVFANYAEMEGKKIHFNSGLIELEYDTQYGMPDIKVDFNISPGVEVETPLAKV